VAIQPATLERAAESTVIAIGQECKVLDVLARLKGRLSVLVDLEREMPVGWDSELFEATDPTIASVWD
jgi:hypothetical protein